MQIEYTWTVTNWTPCNESQQKKGTVENNILRETGCCVGDVAVVSGYWASFFYHAICTPAADWCEVS